MWDWLDFIPELLSYIGDLGSNVGSWVGDLFSGGGDALASGLESGYGDAAASFLGDPEAGLGGGMDVATDVGSSGLDYGGGGLDYTGVGSMDYGGGMNDVPALGNSPWEADYGATASSEPWMGDFPGQTPEGMGDWSVDNPATNTSTSDFLRSRTVDPGTPGTQPFTGLTADPLSSGPGGGNIPDWLKAAAQMAGNFAKGALGGGGGAGGGGLDPYTAALMGRGVPSVGPAGAPDYLNVGGVPQGGAQTPGQLAPMGGLPGMEDPRLGGQVGGGQQAQGIGTPQMANITGQQVGSPNTFGAPPPRNLNPFAPMMIPLPQAPMYPGIQNQPMSGLQRLMMAG